MQKLYSFILIMLVVFGLESSQKTAIVFHHDGPSQIPGYSVYALKQAAYFNPHTPIYVLVNANSINFLSKQGLSHNTHIIPIEKINKTPIHLQFQKKKLEFYQSPAFQNLKDLNWYCYDRFFSLYDFLMTKEIENVFLLENDNLLYCELDLVASHLQDIEIGFTAMSEKIIICGISFFKNYAPLEKLCAFIYENFNPYEVDFVFWPKFKNKFPEIAKDLPVISEYDFQKQALKNHENFYPTNLLDRLQSIFDHAVYGQYLCKAEEAKKGFINRACVFDPTLINYKWALDDKGRLAPFVLTYEGINQKLIRINNLHVHSKNLKRYQTYQPLSKF